MSGSTVLTAARALRRLRAGVRPELPPECPICGGALSAHLHRSPANARLGLDWGEFYVSHCERCGACDRYPVEWPKERACRCSQTCWGPVADAGENEEGSWDAQRSARSQEPRPTSKSPGPRSAGSFTSSD